MKNKSELHKTSSSSIEIGFFTWRTGQTSKNWAVITFNYDNNGKNTFTLPCLGKLVLVTRKARIGRNPATGKSIKIAAKRVVKFRVAKAAKDAILGVKFDITANTENVIVVASLVEVGLAACRA